MFRNTRYFGKNDGKHNLYGELEYIQDWDEEPEDTEKPSPNTTTNTEDEEE